MPVRMHEPEDSIPRPCVYTGFVADSPNGTDPSGPGAFDRFERLTKRLVAVPKAEVDALKKREQRNKRRRAARKAS
jgi:hypothetical protein